MESGNVKARLAAAVKKRMESTPLDRITVTDLVRDAHITRQTFYRNFRDKYDLVNWHFEQLVQQSFLQIGVSLTLREGLLKKFQFIREEWCFFNGAFRSQDYNSLMTYDYQCILQFYTGVITRKTGRPLSADIAFLLEMYCRGSIHMTVGWVTGRMPGPIEEVVDPLIQALPPRLEGLLSDL